LEEDINSVYDNHDVEDIERTKIQCPV